MTRKMPTPITEQARVILLRHMRSTAEPSQYIAGFVTVDGRQLALERARDRIYLWSEPLDLAMLPTDIQGAHERHYAAEKSRSSNLNAKNAVRLSHGNAADYWCFDSLDQLERFIILYQTK